MTDLDGLNLEVYNVIRKLSNKGRRLSFREISRMCSKELSISNSEIRSVLDFLIKNKIIIEKSRIYFKEDLLENKNRKNILLLIQSTPGIHFTKIIKKLGLSPSIVRWHLYMLIRFGFIRERKISSYKVYFAKKSPEKWDLKFFFLRNPTTLAIFDIILNQPFISIKELKDWMELHYTTIQYHIKKLEKVNLIESKNDEYKLTYCVKNNDDFLDTFIERRQKAESE